MTVMAGFGFTVATRVKGVPVQLRLSGVNARGVIVYVTTAFVVLDALISESVIFPVPLALLPVTDPELTPEAHEKVLPAIPDAGVKFNAWLEQLVVVAFVPVLFGKIRKIIESLLTLLPQLPVALRVEEPDR